MGHLITANGLQPDQVKIRSIVDMPAPCDLDGVGRFIGLFQYLAKFIPNLSHFEHCSSWIYFSLGTVSNRKVLLKWNVCSDPPMLTCLNVNKPLDIECNASKDGLGAILIQEGQVVAYASHSVTNVKNDMHRLRKKCCQLCSARSNFTVMYLARRTS